MFHNSNILPNSTIQDLSISLYEHTIDDGLQCQKLNTLYRMIAYLSSECPPPFTHKQLIKTFASVSSLSGYISISFWLFAQLPQVIKNHADKSVDGFSVGFLLCWFAGDFLNFFSCLLNEALMFQILLSLYYCLIDLVLALQYYYYKHMYSNPESKWCHKAKSTKLRAFSPKTSLRNNLQALPVLEENLEEGNSDKSKNMSENVLIPREHIKSSLKHENKNNIHGSFRSPNKSLTNLVSTSFVMGFSKVKGFPITQPRQLEDNSILHKIIQFFMTINSYKIGKLMAWSCTLFYLTSRIPQIITNSQLKSTKGVSIKLIVFALCGNFFYSLSLLLCESSTIGGEVSKQFWESEISYLIGSMGTVVFDAIVVIQWYRYDSSPNTQEKASEYHEVIVGSNIIRTNGKNKYIKKLKSPIVKSSPINFKTPLSPSHVRKLSEFTPLSPIDFLLDDYMQQERRTGKNSIRGSLNESIGVIGNGITTCNYGSITPIIENEGCSNSITNTNPQSDKGEYIDKEVEDDEWAEIL